MVEADREHLSVATMTTAEFCAATCRHAAAFCQAATRRVRLDCRAASSAAICSRVLRTRLCGLCGCDNAAMSKTHGIYRAMA